ncbi:MAG: O-methyltransferase [Paramuribaculum sp.]|nr:O-methyltransferase [Paramuribaculum sp.]
MCDTIDEYILGHISPEPEPLRQLYRHTHLHHLYPRMCSGHLQGRVLKMITAMIKPKRVLELGTFTGYSALCIAEAMGKDGIIDTVEIYDEMEDELRERFANCGLPPKINLHIGDALEIVPKLQGEWDMVYIDANKRHYIQYYQMIIDRLTPGGFIVADNTLWDGKVLSEPSGSDAQTHGIMEFNDMIAADTRVETVILPLRDGLTLIRKLS